MLEIGKAKRANHPGISLPGCIMTQAFPEKHARDVYAHDESDAAIAVLFLSQFTGSLRCHLPSFLSEDSLR